MNLLDISFELKYLSSETKIKNYPGLQDTVPLIFLAKNLLFMTLGLHKNIYKNTLGATSP